MIFFRKRKGKNNRDDGKKSFKRSAFHIGVNVFVGFFEVLIALILLLIGVMQTSTFRNYLREEILEQINKNVKGEFFIGELNGTLLTSVKMSDVGYIEKGDTTFSVSEFGISFGFLPLLEKKILVKEILLKNPKIKLLEKQRGEWTLLTALEGEKDTSNVSESDAGTSSNGDFPFKIELANLSITNGNFVVKNFEHLDSDTIYANINYSDISIGKFDLELNALFDIAGGDYYVDIRNLSFTDNLKKFELRKLTLSAYANRKYAELKKLYVKTDSSEFSCSAKLNGFSPFGDTELKASLPATVKLNAQKFAFSDLNTFLPSLNFLNESVKADLIAEGKYGNLDIRKLNLSLGETKLNLNGKLRNLDNPENLYIDAKINGNVNYDEVENLLAGLQLPDFNGLKLNDLEIEYSGEPLKFKSEISAKIDSAQLNAKAYMDLTRDEIVYDYEVAGKELNLFPVLNTNTNLNLYIKMSGSGFNPEKMKNEIVAKASKSKFDGYDIGDFDCRIKSDSGKISLKLDALVNRAKMKLNGHYEITRESEAFDLIGEVGNLDLAELLQNPELASEFNFGFAANAENFTSPDINGEIQVNFDSTVFMGSRELSGKKISLSVWSDSLERHVDLKSDLIDAEFYGNYDYRILPGLIAEQTARVAEIINENVLSKVIENKEAKKEKIPEFENVDLTYNIVFNSANILSKIFNVDAFSVAGYSFGNLRNLSSKYEFRNSTYLSNFIFIDGENVYYIDNGNFSANLSNSNKVNSIDSLRLSVSLKGDKILAGVDLSNVNVNLSVKGENIYLSSKAIIDSAFGVNAVGEISVSEKADSVNLDLLRFSSGGVIWENAKPVEILLSDGAIDFRRLIMRSDSAMMKINGPLVINGEKESDLNFEITKARLSQIDKMLLGKTLGFDGAFSFRAGLRGKTASPVISTEINCMGFSYEKAIFGNLHFDANYSNGQSKINLKMQNRNFLKQPLSLSLEGTINKSFFGEREDGGELDIRLTADNFNLSPLSALTEDLRGISGKLNADVRISGKLDNPSYNGFAKLEKGKFYVTANGLDYLAEGRLKFEDKILSIENFYLMNDPATDFDGKVNVGGKISLDKYNLNVLNLELNGGLGLLSEKTKFVNPYFYGNLFVETGGKWKFSYVNDRAFLEGALKIVDANITISSTSGGAEVDISNIDYIYVADSSQITENKAQELLEKYLRSQLEAAAKNDENDESFFDYNLTFDIVNRATLNFVFSKVVNQKLKAITNGSIKISSINGENVVQGEFRLLPGSRLDFFRTFEATGVIRFERQILNPFLDITAVYKGAHYIAQGDGLTEEDVAVKIKLQGLLKDLGKNLTSKKSNIAVYVGKKNIDNDIPDPKLDASDAMTFILFGKFNNDLTSSEQYKFTNELTSSATAMLGTVMGVFLNSAMGDLINDVDISKTQTRTKIMLKGRLGRFYYSIGGSQEVFQDIAQANWKVEYFFNKNLSFRVERREPLTGYLSNKQMTDEIGIKYKVSF